MPIFYPDILDQKTAPRTFSYGDKDVMLYALGVGVLLTVTVGLTRIYLGAHWASDVFAGWSVGAAWAMVLWLVAYAIERRQRLHDAPLQDAHSTNV